MVDCSIEYLDRVVHNNKSRSMFIVKYNNDWSAIALPKNDYILGRYLASAHCHHSVTAIIQIQSTIGFGLIIAKIIAI
jgi:hypothetical protein